VPQEWFFVVEPNSVGLALAGLPNWPRETTLVAPLADDADDEQAHAAHEAETEARRRKLRPLAEFEAERQAINGKLQKAGGARLDMNGLIGCRLYTGPVSALQRSSA
jgi:hypothetical protein